MVTALAIGDVLMRLYIPYGIMVSLNIKVIMRLRQSKRRVGLNILSQTANQATTDKSFRFTITTILIDFIYLVFNLPRTILSIYYTAQVLNLNILNTNKNHVFVTIYNYTMILPLCYSAALIILFFIFNRIFRKEIVTRLEKIIHLISPHSLNSSTNIEIINMY